MKHIIESMDVHIQEGLEIGGKFIAPAWGKKISKVLFCGMGGSAIGGDILKTLTSFGKPLVFEVNRTGRFPRWVDASTLVILSSYSGQTPETLNQIAPALRAGAKILALTSGGQLEKTAALKKIPCIKVPAGLPPRCAIGYLTFSLVPVFHKWGWLSFSSADSDEVLRTVRGVSRSQARAIAKKLFGKSVHFYGFSGFSEPVVTRWRAQLAENSKMLASFHLIPEMLHNEVEAWRFPKDIVRKSAAVFLSDKTDLPAFTRKIKAVQGLVRKAGGDAIELRSKGRSPAARLFSLIILADWVSYELADMNGIDPVIIPNINLLKKIS